MFPFTYVQLKGSRLKKNDKSKHSEHCWTKPMFSFLTLCCKKDSLQWFSELAASQWLLLLLARGFAGALGTPRAGGHPRATAGHSRSYFRSCTRPPTVPSPAAGGDWMSPELSSGCSALCAGDQTARGTVQLSSILHPKNSNYSSVLAVGPYVSYHVACHDHFSKLITFHCAEHSHYLASLSVPSV